MSRMCWMSKCTRFGIVCVQTQTWTTTPEHLLGFTELWNTWFIIEWKKDLPSQTLGKRVRCNHLKILWKYENFGSDRGNMDIHVRLPSLEINAKDICNEMVQPWTMCSPATDHVLTWGYTRLWGMPTVDLDKLYRYLPKIFKLGRYSAQKSSKCRDKPLSPYTVVWQNSLLQLHNYKRPTRKSV
jgi:hypothetical protein